MSHHRRSADEFWTKVQEWDLNGIAMELAYPQRRLSEPQYLEIERGADFKSGFYHGEMFAMAGRTRAHSLTGLEAVIELPGLDATLALAELCAKVMAS